MRTQKTNYVYSLVLLLILLVLLVCHLIYAFTPSKNDTIEITAACLFVFVVLPFCVIRFISFEKVVFGTEEITFYKNWRKVGTLAWKDITEIGYSCLNPSESSLQQPSAAFCIAYTATHTITPVFNMRGKLRNKSPQGKRYKLNCDSSPIAWSFHTIAADNDLFLQHLKYRRPELLKSKNKKNNCIGYD